MRVEELIEKLKKADPKAIVALGTYRGDLCDSLDPKVFTAKAQNPPDFVVLFPLLAEPRAKGLDLQELL
jgi:hypothetical protein